MREIAGSYSPGIGRFTSEDVARDGLNWYTYCGNNPVMYTDSSGCMAVSTRYGNGQFSIFVSPQWLDAGQTGLGLVSFFTPLNYLGQRFIAGNRKMGMDWWSVAGTATNAVDTIFDTAIGPFGTALEGGFTAYDWLVAHEYQIEEAVYNHLSRGIWISDSRDLVDSKYRYAMKEMAYWIGQGKIEQKKAVDYFGAGAFGDNSKIYRYDPLTGEKKFYHKNDYYFFSLDDSMKGKFKDLEDTIKQGIWL